MDFKSSEENKIISEIDGFINKLVTNLKNKYNINSNNTTKLSLDEVLNVIQTTKKNHNKNPNEEKTNETTNKLSMETMTKNLKELMPNDPATDNGENKTVEFAELLENYLKFHNYDFKNLEFSKDDMYWSIEAILGDNETVVKLLEIYMNNGYDINHCPEERNDPEYPLLHRCIAYDVYDTIRYLLLNYKDKIDFDIVDMGGRTAYDFCIKRGLYNMASLITTAKLGLNLSNSIEKYCNNNLEINSISNLFLYYLKKNCNMNDTLETTMELLEKVLSDLITNKKAFSPYLLKIVFDYHLSKSSNVLNVKNDKLWITIKNKLTEVLSIKTLYYEKVDWFWFKTYLLDSNIWLLKTNNNKKILYNELLSIVKVELKKQKDDLKNDMKLLISNNKNTWNNICQFEYNNKKYSVHRQDIVPNGIQSSYSKSELNGIYAKEKGKFDIFSLNDYSNYLSKLIMVAHKIDEKFEVSIKSILKPFIDTKKCKFKTGPVKKLERCQVKAQLDYNNSKYPTSACVIDIIRGSCTFTNLTDYYNSIKHFIDVINNKNSNIKHYIIDILRIKNGFNKKYKEFLKSKQSKEEEKTDENDYFIPTGYLDVKMNLVLCYNNESIVSELQFLLKPMLANKKKNHELYEITRLRDIIKHSKKNIDDLNPNKQLKIAISDKNKNKIAKLIVLSNDSSININEIGNDESKTPLFMESIPVTNSAGFDLLIPYFGHKFDLKSHDKKNENVLHYVAMYCDEENETNRRTITSLLNLIVGKDKTNLSHLKAVLNHQNKSGVTAFMACVEYNIYSSTLLKQLTNIMNKYSNINIINFGLLDNRKNNIFHYLFQNWDFNAIDIDIIMKKYKLYNKLNNTNNYNLLFSKNSVGRTIFDEAFEGNESFSLEILKKLEDYLSDNNKFYTMLFETQNTEDNNTSLMYLVENRENNKNIPSIADYLLTKFKDKIAKNNYKSLTQIKNENDKTVIDLVKELKNENKIKVLFKSKFNKLF